MVHRGEIQGFVYKGFPEIRPRQLERNLKSRTAQAIVIRIVDVEHEVHRAALQPEPGYIDLLQLDIGLLEIEGRL